eukprot:763076-Rhodomonas_salina.1
MVEDWQLEGGLRLRVCQCQWPGARRRPGLEGCQLERRGACQSVLIKFLRVGPCQWLGVSADRFS